MKDYACLPDLTAVAGDQLSAVMNELSGSLSDFSGSWSIAVRVASARKSYCWNLHKKGKTCGAKMSDGEEEKHDLELVVKDTTWRDIVSGKLSPIMALLQGELFVRGDTDLAVAALDHVRAKGEICDICHTGE